MDDVAAGRGRFFLFAVALSLVFGSPLSAETSASCRRVSLGQPPGLVTAAAWRAGGELVVVDRLAGKLLRFDARGEPIGEILRPGSDRFAINQPFHVQAVGDGLVVQDGLYRLVWLDAALEGTRSADTRGRVALLDHTVVDGSVFVYGTAPAALDGKPWGFFELAAEDLAQRRLVHPIEPEALSMFSLSRPVVAQVGGVAYGLDYGPPPTLRRLSEPGTRLAAFPDGFETLPSFPGKGGPEAIERFYGIVEQSRVPAQLHGFGRHLYLLTRHPSPESGTVWELHRIDPEKDAVEATLRLPSGSPDLEIVPGEPDWAVIEKGRIRLGGRQDVLGVLLLPASWLDGSTPSPLDDENAPDCR